MFFFVMLASSSKFYDGTSSVKKKIAVIMCLNAVDKYCSMIFFHVVYGFRVILIVFGGETVYNLSYIKYS